MRLDGIGKRYGLRQPWVVRDVRMDLPPGRLVRLEGRNGAGKSTLLRVIAGVCAPSAGTVTGRQAVGYVPERFPPALPFSGRDYLTHLGRVHGLRGTALADRVAEWLDRLGGSEYAGFPMHSLSKGMCQKIAVAQALLPGPGLLVLDEAWTGLDQAARAVLDDEVAGRVADGGTVVFVDQDPARLAGLPYQRWQVSDGQVTELPPASGAPEVPGAPAGVAEVPGAPAGAPEVPGAPAGVGAGAWSAAAATAAVVVIELSGCPPGLLPPGGLPGLLSARQDGDRLVLCADPAASDQVLRTMLAAASGLHVSSVREQPCPAGLHRPARPADPAGQPGRPGWSGPSARPGPPGEPGPAEPAGSAGAGP